MEIRCQAGSIIDERYQLEKLLGEGGHGSVWLAEDVHLKRKVAIKVVRAHAADDGQTVARLQREAKVLQRLDHANIVQVFRIGVLDDDSFYLAMEYVEGRDLHALLAKGALSVAAALRIAEQVADGMFEAEQRGVIHRDLKPQNILIFDSEGDGEPQVRVADFGLSTMSQGATMQFGTLTREGVALGTPLYMSPEQCQGKDLDTRSDIYSFGCVLFEMVTGAPPYRGDSPAGILMSHVREPVPNLLNLAGESEVTRDLQAVLAKCLAKRPQDRYQSFADVQTAVSRVAQTECDVKLNVAAPLRIRVKRRRTLLLPAVACAALLACAVVTFANGDEQKAWLVTRFGATLVEPHGVAGVVRGVSLIGELQGRVTARKVAEYTMVTGEFRSWNRAQRIALLQAYSKMFAEGGEPDDAADFADSLLNECMKGVTEWIRGHHAPADAENKALAGGLEFLLQTKWNEQTWKAFGQTMSGYGGVVQSGEIQVIQNDKAGVLAEEMLATSLMKNQSYNKELARRAREHYFHAGGKANVLHLFDRSRANLMRAEGGNNHLMPEAWMNLVKNQMLYGDWQSAQRDLLQVIRLRKIVSSSISDSDLAKVQKELAAGPQAKRQP